MLHYFVIIQGSEVEDVSDIHILDFSEIKQLRIKSLPILPEVQYQTKSEVRTNERCAAPVLLQTRYQGCLVIIAIEHTTFGKALPRSLYLSLLCVAKKAIDHLEVMQCQLLIQLPFTSLSNGCHLWFLMPALLREAREHNVSLSLICIEQQQK